MSEPTCTPYLDCDNTQESIESLFKRLIMVDEEGNLCLNLCYCGNFSTTIGGSDTLVQDVQKTVSFPNAFADTSYSLTVDLRDENGDAVGCNITNRTANGFDITAAANCTLNYIAIAI